MLAIVAVLAAACVYGFVLRPRPDLAPAMGTPRVAFKFLVTLTLAGAAGALAFRAMWPEVEPRLNHVRFESSSSRGLGLGGPAPI